MKKPEQQYIELYEQYSDVICRHSSALMNGERDGAYRRFRANGFPTTKVERYKYTDVAALLAPDYGLNLSRIPIPADPYKAFRCDVPHLSTSLCFVVNDMFYEAASPALGTVVVGSLREHTSEGSPLRERLSACYNRLAGADGDAVTDLNTMLAQDGLLVYVPRQTKVERAVQVVNILRSDVDLMVNRRVLVVAEEGAEVKLLFCDHAADDRRFLTTQVIEVFAGANAKVDLYCLEETHAKNVRLSNVYVSQQAGSRVRHNVITLTGGVTRNKLDLFLEGEGAECDCCGCVVADGQQHVDNNTLIVHRATHCTSHELYKYVLDHESVGAFAGRVLVEHGAQQTASQMTNQNLCSSSQARMFTQPMLEIYADDVKCGHGSTVGQLNDAALFYMQQRGIPKSEAKTLLSLAFVGEVISQIDLIPLRDRLSHLVDKRFRGELNSCKGCQFCK